MQARGEFYEKIILDAQAIRDTNAVNTQKANIQGLGKKSLVVVNTLNQNVTVQIQGSADNTTFINLGTAQTVNTATNAIIGVNEVAPLNNYIPYLRAVVTAAVAPASGAVTVVLVASSM
jgi:hypothetical protein